MTGHWAHRRSGLREWAATSGCTCLGCQNPKEDRVEKFDEGHPREHYVDSDVKPGYESLARVLRSALEDAQGGKGAERHATPGEAFEEQQMVQLGVWMDTPAFAIGQACKKAIESTRMPKDRAVRELLGAINYLAGAILTLEALERT